MELWTDVVEPAELTTFGQKTMADIEKRKGSLAAYLPSKSVSDTVVRFNRNGKSLMPAAEYRSWDAEASIGGTPTGERVTIELPPVSQKLRIGELDVLRSRAASNVPLTQLQKTVGATARSVIEGMDQRVEAQRGQILATGKISINENGFIVNADLGRKDELTVTAATKWDQDDSDVIKDLSTWVDAYIAENDEAPGIMLVSRKVLNTLLQNMSIRKAVAVPNTPTMVTIDQVNALFAAYGLPTMRLYDRKVQIGGEKKRVIDEKVIVFLPENAAELGYTAWGTPAEFGDPQYQVNEFSGGLNMLISAMKTHDPYGHWVRGTAVAMPIMHNPNASMAATVLS